MGETITATWTINGGWAPQGDYLTETVWWIIEGEEIQHGYGGNVVNASSEYMPNYGSSGILELYIRDRNGNELTVQKPFVIAGAGQPLNAVISLDKEAVESGQQIAASWEITGGTPPYTIQAYWYALTSKSDNKVAGEIINNSSSFIPEGGEKGYFELVLGDATGREKTIKSPEFEIRDLHHLEVSFWTDKELFKAGENITLYWDCSGGKEPYKAKIAYWFSDGGWLAYGEDIFLVDKEVIVPISESTEDFIDFSIYVSDSIGREEEVQLKVPVVGHDMLESAITISNMTPQPNDTITISWTVSGGKDPLTNNFRIETFNDEIYYLNRTDYVDGQSDARTVQYTLPDNGNILYVTVSGSDANDKEYNNFKILPFNRGERQKISGDATNDGAIDILDLVSIIDYIVSNNDPTSLTNADANGDGVVDILDLVWIIDQIVGG